MQLLQAAVLNYGPMWQLVEPEVDQESANWFPPRGNPGGCAFSVTCDGTLDTELLWGLPRKWDLLAFQLEERGSTSRLEKGLEVLGELVGMVKLQMARSSLLVRACHLAGGGDVSPEVHGKGMMQLGNAQDIDRILMTGGVKGPNIPGALMSQVFRNLHLVY